MNGRSFCFATVLFLLIHIPFVLKAQTSSTLREYFIEAESFFLFEEYKDALPLYQRILAEEPDNFNVIYKIGICYLNDPYQKHRSIEYLQSSSEHINLKYKVNNYKEKLAPPDALYYLGQAYRIDGQLEKAIDKYTKFKNIVDPEVYDFQVVNAELASCKTALHAQKSPIYEVKTNLGDFLNTRFAEERPVISGDGKTLIFTRKLQFYDGVFITQRKDDGTWTPPQNLTPDFGLDGNSYTTGISYNGDEVLVYRSDNFDGNIYSSKKVDGRWQKLVKLNSFINTKYWESHASFSPDGKSLYFTSNRKGGYGGLDIYRSQRLADGTWGEPVNLGPIVNSPSNDDTPFISPVDNRLYFSSLGHNGIGGYDIFVTELVGPEKWAKPVNMGYPFNTTDDDLFFCPVNIENYTGIMSRYDQQTTYGLFDMYWMEVYNEILPREFTVSGDVTVPETVSLADMGITATLVNSQQGIIVDQIQVDSSGQYALNAPQGEYQLLVDGQGINPVSVPVTLNLTQEASVINLALIAAVTAIEGQNDNAYVAPVAPVLVVTSENYVVTDSSPVIVLLDVEPNSELKVETKANNEIVNTEDFYTSKNKFSYSIDPVAGETILLFTMTGKNGVTAKEEVLVYFTPPSDEEIEGEITEEDIKSGSQSLGMNELTMLSAGGLQAYLLTLGDLEYDNKTDLYNTLVANAENNDYTVEEVNELFAILLTQRDKEEFLAELNTTNEFNDIRLTDSILDAIDLPYSIVEESRNTYSASGNQISVGLLKMVPFEGSGESELNYIFSFVDEKYSGSESLDGANEVILLDELNSQLEGEKAIQSVDLAATSVNLDFLHQSMLIATEGELHNMLAEINLYQEGIDNSIDLVNYLFENAAEHNVTIAEIIAALEATQSQRDENLHTFKEALASSATGNLKTSIEDVAISNPGINTYEKMIEELLKDARSSDYNAQEVYQLLIDLIGIDNVAEFSEVFTAFAPNQLDSLIHSSSNQNFSTPTELIQYLITQSPYFDYTESDINNLLLRMLLEKGVEGYLQNEDLLQSEKLIKRRRIATTLIFVNSLIVILIVLFWRRRKQNQSK